MVIYRFTPTEALAKFCRIHLTSSFTVATKSFRTYRAAVPSLLLVILVAKMRSNILILMSDEF